MGLSSYFRKFIPNFASRTACIRKLLKIDQKWEWGLKQDAAKNYVIDHLVSKSLLHADASSIGYGAILLQRVTNIRSLHIIVKNCSDRSQVLLL